MIQHKLTKRNLEIEKHVKHFQVMDVQLWYLDNYI